MYDVNQFKKDLDDGKAHLGAKVDNWVKDHVLPDFRNHNGYEVPDWIGLGDLVRMLEQRGFLVNYYSGYQGSYVYISLPPGEE